MNTLGTITDGLTAYLLGSVLPGLLLVLGSIMLLVFSAYGVLMVIAHLKGQSSASVAYKIGRIFGEEVYENQYEAYRAKRRHRERQDSFRSRYKRDGG